MYRVDNINLEGCLTEEDENGGELLIPQPDRLQLSFERISATGILKKCLKNLGQVHANKYRIEFYPE